MVFFIFSARWAKKRGEFVERVFFYRIIMGRMIHQKPLDLKLGLSLRIFRLSCLGFEYPCESKGNAGFCIGNVPELVRICLDIK